MNGLLSRSEWAASPLGAPERWSDLLRRSAELCLDSRLALSLAWGPDRALFYNEAFARVCGNKHPRALGRDFRECWSSAWPVLEPHFERAEQGEGCLVEDAHLFVDHTGPLREAFFTFSFTPVRDDAGDVVGVLQSVEETTAKMLSMRRSALLARVSAAGRAATTARQAVESSLAALTGGELDIPFALAYDGDFELLACTASAPEACTLDDRTREKRPVAIWQVPAVASSGQTRILSGLEARFGPLASGPYPEAPDSAVLLPIVEPSAVTPYAVLVAAASPRCPLDHGYRGFFEQLAHAISSNVAWARAHERAASQPGDASRELARRQWAEHLQRANHELEAFSYSVSHDLRTPLRAIDGFSQAVLAHKSHQLDEQGKQYLRRVRKAAARMSELIDELLNLARVSHAPLRREHVSLSDLAREVADGLREQQGAREVSFQTDPDLVARADGRLLRIVLENLLGNSWKFTAGRADARVRFGQARGAEPPTYFVIDNGAGFDQLNAHRLFQPFQRLHSEEDFAGTGIGLAIVHRIVTRHGGRIWAEGREGFGATFYFTLSEAS
jgi:signal transduction histidine kinase